MRFEITTDAIVTYTGHEHLIRIPGTCESFAIKSTHVSFDYMGRKMIIECPDKTPVRTYAPDRATAKDTAGEYFPKHIKNFLQR